jgi:hypothetical protein
MDELEQLQEVIFREIQRTEKAMHDTNLREDTDRGMSRIDALNWVLNEILVLKREEEISVACSIRNETMKPCLFKQVKLAFVSTLPM